MDAIGEVVKAGKDTAVKVALPLVIGSVIVAGIAVAWKAFTSK